MVMTDDIADDDVDDDHHLHPNNIKPKTKTKTYNFLHDPDGVNGRVPVGVDEGAPREPPELNEPVGFLSEERTSND